MRAQLFAFVLVALLASSLPSFAQSPSPSPHGMRREAIAVLRGAGVFHDGRRVHSVWPLGDHWVVVVRDRDGTLHNYSSDPRTDTFGEICNH